MMTWDDFKKQPSSLSQDEIDIIDTLSMLQATRIKRGITQKQLAEKSGLSQPQIAKIENLDSMPTLKTLRRYAAGLGLKINLEVVPA
ncbi:helix-turn-helix domain-containing protein [Lactobacillus kefiranofaciens]|uniref:Helix-turn-helix n=1 Tax=Lactobacillus kefiranofaciens TaxID=267818 RepID=A0AAX3UDX1_9LACO|nr:helix-turn-helix transcriptional regulator [Lactobacillus kefiranofaciens]AEG41681.1 Hypothetical protein WANG_p1078 [Lactobacillus kefiranofaciens subsp. kefiranofaciens]KRM20494.1 hypothetical protein FC93_GL001597 [Lactobacillus kefiranofaciens subsp. kefiranofaciens DSM 5016 = JCM 6985]QFQ68316.1 helix-turn-helix transcriptional regulator [Lactobacillus kefiranofaciens subsp. kefiranofaciens]WGO85896.1 helix-turn-helix transcriptional regulator [Lactobacillus kefiranofaciens]WQH36785.1 